MPKIHLFGRFHIAFVVFYIWSVTQSPPTISPLSINKPLSNKPGKIAFLSSRDHVCNSDGMCNETIYTMNLDGSNQQRLVDSKFWVAGASLSPDAMQVVFVSPYFGPQAVYLMTVSGENLRQITSDSQNVFLDVNWSPDNRQLGFTSGSVEYGNTTLRRRDREVYVMDADGADEKQLTNTGWNEFMFWSHDANSIIFLSDRGGDDQVYVMNKDGSNQKPYLPNTLASFDVMSWSLDGNLLLLSSKNDHYGHNVSVLDTESLNVYSLITGAGDDEYQNPVWSPDDRRIALTGWHEDRITGIFVINTDGSNLHSITGDLTFSSAPDYIWSPDGKSVMFQGQDDKNQNYFLYWVDVNENILYRLPSYNIDTLLWWF